MIDEGRGDGLLFSGGAISGGWALCHVCLWWVGGIDMECGGLVGKDWY